MMANEWFKFKQFTILQDRCGMKVGTDGVIFGTWVDVENHRRALDIGTGTGLLALILAQRSKFLSIDAVEIDSDAAVQAFENVQKSKFNKQIAVIHGDFRSYYLHKKPEYDLIICNPPYFSDSMKPANRSRAISRHSQSLQLEEIFVGATMLMTVEGSLNVIVPYDLQENTRALAKSYKLFLRKKLNVIPLPGRNPKRCCLEFSFSEQKLLEETLIIETTGRHNYSDEYIKLTKDFYLDK